MITAATTAIMMTRSTGTTTAATLNVVPPGGSGPGISVMLLAAVEVEPGL
jgi:hypothetical protein